MIPVQNTPTSFFLSNQKHIIDSEIWFSFLRYWKWKCEFVLCIKPTSCW